MAAKEPGQLEFRGEDATECENFINAVARHALSVGKQRDDQWVADFASSCCTHNAIRWWNSLNDETQGSWKLFRNAILARYHPLFHGRDGEEAEEFIRMVHERAFDEGKLNDNNWLITFALTCFAGDALRWHALLEPSIQTDWIKLRQAILAQYPRDSQGILPNLIPTPAAAAAAAAPPVGITAPAPRRGRIRVTKDRDPKKYYIGDSYIMDVYIGISKLDFGVLTVEWDWPCSDLQALTIRDSWPGYDAIGARQVGSFGKLNLTPMWREVGMGPSLSGTTTTDVFKGWKISESVSSQKPGFDLIPMSEGGQRLYAQLDKLQNIILVPSKLTTNGVSAGIIGALMAATEPGHLELRGEDSAECEAFITAVARQALSVGKQRGDQWVADFAASRSTHNALRWWNSLNDETEGSWRLLRKAMLSRYRPSFHGRDGEEAEKFVHMVCKRALDEGKLNDNNWLITLIPTPAAAAAAPTVVIGASPKPIRRGWILVMKDAHPTKYYIGRSYIMGVYIRVSSTETRAMTVEWDWPCSSDLQALTIHDSFIGYNVIGARQAGSFGKLNRVPMWRGPRLGPSLSGTAGTDVFKGWKISESASSQNPGFDLVPMNEAGQRLYAQVDILQKITLVPSTPPINSVSNNGRRAAAARSTQSGGYPTLAPSDQQFRTRDLEDCTRFGDFVKFPA
ncbi:hypothetical protein M407DRAFT_30883 [Tulasnella calospora MUT 4182]|uniref:Uncharacterized protein n=1 Tax=Tulasnella calospora MUT 4182 TaxID=1051891 RepID=A0A0C3Q6K7_9AGAM|nr:hypothetical protein M407DRAFT_30883 [Tulasnella calospora MUT 4182]